jgi:hypothetical protein
MVHLQNWEKRVSAKRREKGGASEEEGSRDEDRHGRDVWLLVDASGIDSTYS